MDIQEAVRYIRDTSGYEVMNPESTLPVATAFGIENPVYTYEHDPDPYSKGFHSDNGKAVTGVSMFSLVEIICYKHDLSYNGSYFGRGRVYREQVNAIVNHFKVEG